MEQLFGNLMTVLFCCAIISKLIQHIIRKTYADLCERFTLFTIGAGFAIGAVGAFGGNNQFSAILYCFGAYLTYVTLLFSWPPRSLTQSEEAN